VFVGSLVVVVASALFVHLWRIGSAPTGLYSDECSQAYNAYCIAQTGADEYGVRYPLFFRCLDNYQDPVLIYCLVPMVKAFGLTKAIARLPAALFHILAALAFGFLVQEYCRNKWVSLFGAALFSFIPWVFPQSRLVFSDTAMLFGMVVGWWLLLLALRKRSLWLATGAGIACAFAMYARALGRPMTVLLLVCFGLAFNRSLLSRWKIGLIFLMSCVMAMLPMIISVAHFPESLTSRFEWISVFQDHPSASEVLNRVGSRYLQYVSPRFLFLAGDPELRHHTGRGGELFLFTIPLILAGIYGVIRFFKTRPYYRLLAYTILVYPAAAVLTVDKMHSGRTITGVISWLLLAMIGARALWFHRRVGRKLLLITSAAGLIEVSAYMVDYFGPYQTRCDSAFANSFNEALQYCFGNLGTNRILYVSRSMGTACGTDIDMHYKPWLYVYLLFYGRIDPWSYQHSGFSNTVVRPYLERIDEPGLLLRCNYRPAVRGKELVLVPNPESVPASAKLLVTFHDEFWQYQIFDVQ
jgi:hypothetical protein